MQRCGPSGMFLLSACFGMFAFGTLKRFLLSACDVLRHVWFWHVKVWSFACKDAVLPCQRHQRWPQELGHCLCPLLQRNLRLNSVARRRRDSSPREKKWFDAMCEEPFDAVAKVVVHSCGKLNVVLSVFVALTTNSIYIAVLLRPGTFPFWYRHRAYDLRAGAVFFVGHRLKSS